jgi:hypothetical protein
MRGCLALPFRLAALAILLLLGYVAWSYREEIRRMVHQWTADEVVAPEERGIAVQGRAAPAAQRVNELLGSRADSVTLSAADVASLLDSLATVVAPGAVDSIEITLGADDLSVRARVDTRAVPVSLGPIGSVVRDHETVEAGGRVVFRQAGRIEWHLDRARVRGIPLPGEVRERLIQGNAIEFGIPRSVTGVRVRPTGVTLYGTGPGR